MPSHLDHHSDKKKIRSVQHNFFVHGDIFVKCTTIQVIRLGWKIKALVYDFISLKYFFLLKTFYGPTFCFKIWKINIFFLFLSTYCQIEHFAYLINVYSDSKQSCLTLRNMNAMLHMWRIYRSISFISLPWGKYKEVVKLQKSVTTLGKTFPEVMI